MDAPEERDGEGRRTTMRRRRVVEAAVALVVVAIPLIVALDPLLRWSATTKGFVALGLLIGVPIAIGVAWYESRGRRATRSEASALGPRQHWVRRAELLEAAAAQQGVRVGCVYVALSALLESWLDVAVDGFDWPDVTRGLVDLVLLLAFPIVVVLAWYHGTAVGNVSPRLSGR